MCVRHRYVVVVVCTARGAPGVGGGKGSRVGVESKAEMGVVGQRMQQGRVFSFSVVARGLDLMRLTRPYAALRPQQAVATW